MPSEIEMREALKAAADTLESLSYIHDGNPSLAMADMPEADYARHMLFEARQMAREAHSEARAALASLPDRTGEQVAIKPLQWSDDQSRSVHVRVEDGVYVYWTTDGTLYRIKWRPKTERTAESWTVWHGGFPFAFLSSMEKAKAAAQDDHDKRILAALTAPPDAEQARLREWVAELERRWKDADSEACVARVKIGRFKTLMRKAAETLNRTTERAEAAERDLARKHEAFCIASDQAMVNGQAARAAEARLAQQAERATAVTEAAERVVWFDWSDNDPDAVAAIETLQSALAEPHKTRLWDAMPSWDALVSGPRCTTGGDG